MKKLALTTSILALLVIAVPQVSAMGIEIQDNGQVLFYQDGVLGRTTDNQRGAGATQQADPIKTVAPAATQRLNVKTTDDDAVEVEITKPGTQNFVSSEKMEANRLDVRFPAQPESAEPARAEMGQMNGDLVQQRSEYQEQLLEQRQERAEEMVMLKSQMRADGQGFQLESRGVQAGIAGGSEFSVDPSTNQVTITTPSGNEQTLYHLPDQAVERMLEAGVIESKQDAENLDLTSTQDGQLVYATDSLKTKRALGLFPWQKKTQVVLNDQTGEILEQELPADSLMGQILDIISN